MSDPAILHDLVPQPSSARDSRDDNRQPAAGLTRRSRRADDLRTLLARRVSHCRVDAGGVAAEWVEACVASPGQPTLVHFSGGGHGVEALERSRSLAGELAVRSGARILVVACRQQPDQTFSAAVERGVAAYAWLLGEGCDANTTAFSSESFDEDLVAGIVELAGNGLRLPIPAHQTLLATLSP